MTRMTTAQEHQALQEQVARMDEKLDQLIDAVRRLSHDVERLTEDVAATKEIVTAWSAVKTWGKFVTWIAGILGGLFFLWSAWKGIPK
jgi:outer membrane murein-binding lipoprotein Lpp